MKKMRFFFKKSFYKLTTDFKVSSIQKTEETI